MLRTRSLHRQASSGQSISSLLSQVNSKNNSKQRKLSSKTNTTNVLTYIWKITLQKRLFSSDLKPSIAFEGNQYQDPWSSYGKPTYKTKKFPKSSYLPYLPSASPISESDSVDKKQIVTDQMNIDPLNELGKVLVLEKGNIEKYFPEGLLGEFKKKDHQLIHKGEKVGFLIRQEAVNAISAIHEKFWLRTKRNHILLHGVDGCGKSGVLSSVIVWARSHGHVVLVVRNGRDITHPPVMMERSVSQPGFFDTIEPAYNTLQGFYKFHSKQLSQIKLKTKFKLPAFERNEQSTVADLVQHALKFKQLSCDVLTCLKGELEQTTEFPVVVAVDDISSFFTPNSGHYDPRELKKLYIPFLPPRFLTMANLFGQLWNLKNGAYVAATSGPSKPIHLFRNSPWKSPRTVQQIEVPALRKPEFDTLMEYLDKYSYFKRDVPGGERNFVYYMCGGRPKDIMRYSTVM